MIGGDPPFTLKIFPSLENLPDCVHEVFRLTEKKSFFFSYPWFKNLEATTLDDTASLRVYWVGPTGRENQVILVGRSPASRNGSIFDRNRLGGTSLSGFTNFQTCQFSPLFICHGMDEHRLAKDLAYALCQEKPGWDYLDFNALDPHASWFPGFMKGFQLANMKVVPYFHFGNWYENTAGWSYGEYVNSRPAPIKKNLQNYARKGRKLEKLGKLRFEVFKEMEFVEQGIKDYERIYRKSWKEPEYYADFTPGLFRSAAARGALRLGILYFKEIPIAVEAGVLCETGVTMVKTAYDQSFKDYSVGALAMMRMLEYLLNVDQVDEIDFGRDDNPYKKLWMSQRRERKGIVVFNPRSWIGRAAYVQYQARELYKSVKRTVKEKLLNR